MQITQSAVDVGVRPFAFNEFDWAASICNDEVHFASCVAVLQHRTPAPAGRIAGSCMAVRPRDTERLFRHADG
jgi:hypothetical protein